MKILPAVYAAEVKYPNGSHWHIIREYDNVLDAVHDVSKVQVPADDRQPTDKEWRVVRLTRTVIEWEEDA